MQSDTVRFVRTILARYWLGMLSAIDAALIEAARRRQPTRPSDVEFMRFLIAARAYLLSDGRQRPAGLDDEQFLQLKPVCESLVAQGRFPDERLQLFEGLEAWPALPPAPDPLQYHRRHH